MEKTNQKKSKARKLLLQFIIKVLVFILIVWAVFTFVLGWKRVSENNMFPMLKDGDLCVFYRLSNVFMNDVVIYKDAEGNQRIGRVVGLEGQMIDFPSAGGYTINNSMPSEYIPYDTYKSDQSDVNYPLLIGHESYFVLNDFRSDDTDSRKFGVIPKSDIMGKVIYLLRRRSF